MKPTPTKPVTASGARAAQPVNPLILAFGAHPDDIEFGCGGVIARETQAGHAAHFVVCSRGEAGTHGTPAQRTAEAKKSAELLGATLEFIELGGDSHMEPKLAHVIKFADIIRRVRPCIVLAPTIVENQHPDHVHIGRMVRDAARLARYGGLAELKKHAPHSIQQLMFYAVTVEAEPADRSAVLMDVSAQEVVAAWTASMEAHASQAKTRRYVGLHLARAKMHGVRCGSGHAIQLFPNDPLVCNSLATLGCSARQF
jgi:N-acetylglucosamine malate deacetylase 1